MQPEKGGWSPPASCRELDSGLSVKGMEKGAPICYLGPPFHPANPGPLPCCSRRRRRIHRPRPCRGPAAPRRPREGHLGVYAAETAAAAESLGLEKGYADYAELLRDKEVRVVHLASPNKVHHAQVLVALDAGKHVVREKLLSMTLGRGGRARRGGGAPSGARLRGELQRAILPAFPARPRDGPAGGPGRTLPGPRQLPQDWLLYPTDFNWRVLAEEGGRLRAIGDIGTHWLDLVLFITGLEVESVVADLRTVHPVRRRPKGGSVETFKGTEGAPAGELEDVPIATEDCGSVAPARFRWRGRRYDDLAGHGRPQEQRSATRSPDRGARWHGTAMSLQQLQIGYRERANRRDDERPVPPRSSICVLRQLTREATARASPDTFKQLYRAVYEDIRARPTARRRPSTPTFADGRRELLLCEAIAESQERGGWVLRPGLTPSPMKLGFVSAILPDLDLEGVLAFARDSGFNGQRLRAGRLQAAERRYAGVTHVDAAAMQPADVRRIQGLCAGHGVALSGLGYYLEPAGGRREGGRRVHRAPEEGDHRLRAARLQRRTPSSAATRPGAWTTTGGWSTSAGRRSCATRSRRGCGIGIENCPMLFSQDEWPGGANLPVSEALAGALPPAAQPLPGLNYDPSHLVWQQMDYIAPLAEFRDRLFHVHAKDAKVDRRSWTTSASSGDARSTTTRSFRAAGTSTGGAFWARLPTPDTTARVCIESRTVNTREHWRRARRGRAGAAPSSDLLPRIGSTSPCSPASTRGTNFVAAFGDAEGRLAAEDRQPTLAHEGPSAVLRRIAESIEGLPVGRVTGPRPSGSASPGLSISRAGRPGSCRTCRRAGGADPRGGHPVGPAPRVRRPYPERRERPRSASRCSDSGAGLSRRWPSSRSARESAAGS